MSIVRSIRPRIELQFQIHREGWRIQIAREAEGLESDELTSIVRSIRPRIELQFQIHREGLSSYLDSPAFSMDLKL